LKYIIYTPINQKCSELSIKHSWELCGDRINWIGKAGLQYIMVIEIVERPKGRDVNLFNMAYFNFKVNGITVKYLDLQLL